MWFGLGLKDYVSLTVGFRIWRSSEESAACTFRGWFLPFWRGACYALNYRYEATQRPFL